MDQGRVEISLGEPPSGLNRGEGKTVRRSSLFFFLPAAASSLFFWAPGWGPLTPNLYPGRRREAAARKKKTTNHQVFPVGRPHLGSPGNRARDSPQAIDPRCGPQRLGYWWPGVPKNPTSWWLKDGRALRDMSPNALKWGRRDLGNSSQNPFL